MSGSRRLGVPFAVMVLAAGSALVPACVCEKTTTRTNTTSSELSGGGAREVTATESVTASGVTGRLVSKSEVNTTTSTTDGKTSTEVAIKVDDHPPITRTFDFPVEVVTGKAQVEGVARREVTIKKKPGGTVVEVIRL